MWKGRRTGERAMNVKEEEETKTKEGGGGEGKWIGDKEKERGVEEKVRQRK